MKSYYNIFLLCFMAIGCQAPPDETAEFIRLEKELGELSHDNDKANFVNIYAQYGDLSERLAFYTDSLLAISTLYDSPIGRTQKTDYSTEMKTVIQKIEHRKIKQEWDRFKTDSLFVINSNIDNDFRKYALQVKLSQVLSRLNSAVSICGGVYPMMELHRYLTYQRQGDTISGEYGLGYIVTDDLTAQLQLTHNGQTIAPKMHSADYQKTEATFIPQDTGTYILTGDITLTDPITGKRHKIQEQRSIYVKP